MIKNKIKKMALITASFLVLVGVVACSSGEMDPTTNTAPSPQQSKIPNVSSTGPKLPATEVGISPQSTNTLSGIPANNISGDGTIGIANYANLYFGSAGQITAINVNEGDYVTKGKVLAKLDTTSLEAALALAKVNLDQAKLAQTQAKSALITAQFNLDKTKTVSDIKDIITDDQLAIKDMQMNLAQAQAVGDSGAVNALSQNMVAYQKDLKNQEDTLAKVLSQDPYTSAEAALYNNGQKYDRMTIEDIQNKQLAIDSAQEALDKSQNTIVQAQKSIEVAQLQLNQATITAPFDGIIATVNQNAGDIVSAPSPSGHPIIYMIDSSTMELNIAVNELDMPAIKIGNKAVVNQKAYPGTKIDGRVIAISPLPTVQGGITDYTVTLTFSIPSNIDVRIGMNGSVSIPAN